ncbi:unnamed protein product [Urochloa humidicola]
MGVTKDLPQNSNSQAADHEINVDVAIMGPDGIEEHSKELNIDAKANRKENIIGAQSDAYDTIFKHHEHNIHHRTQITSDTSWGAQEEANEPRAAAAYRDRESGRDVGEGRVDTRSGSTVSSPSSHTSTTAAQVSGTTPQQKHGKT